MRGTWTRAVVVGAVMTVMGGGSLALHARAGEPPTKQGSSLTPVEELQKIAGAPVFEAEVLLAAAEQIKNSPKGTSETTLTVKVRRTIFDHDSLIKNVCYEVCVGSKCLVQRIVCVPVTTAD